MKIIPLTQGYEAMVDDEDYARVIEYTWYIRKTHGIYACHTRYKQPDLFLHNFIMSPLEGFTVDHIDRNGLNCQRNNMRFATFSQQMINQKRINSSKFRGVYLNGKNWTAILSNNGTRYYGGTYENILDAAKAYDTLSKKHHGEFAVLNFPNT